MAKSIPYPIAALFVVLLMGSVAIAQESGSADPTTSDGPGGEFILDHDAEVESSGAAGFGPHLVSVHKGMFWLRSWVRGEDVISVVATRSVSQVEAIRLQEDAMESAAESGVSLEKVPGILERADDPDTPLVAIVADGVCVFEFRATRVGLRARLQEAVRSNTATLMLLFVVTNGSQQPTLR